MWVLVELCSAGFCRVEKYFSNKKYRFLQRKFKPGRGRPGVLKRGLPLETPFSPLTSEHTNAPIPKELESAIELWLQGRLDLTSHVKTIPYLHRPKHLAISPRWAEQQHIIKKNAQLRQPPTPILFYHLVSLGIQEQLSVNTQKEAGILKKKNE